MVPNASLNAPYLVLTGAILLAVAMVFLVFHPMIRDIIDRRDQIEANKIILDDRKETLRITRGKINLLRNQAENEARLDIVLPVENSTEDMVRILHVASEEAGIDIQRINNNSTSLQSSLNARRLRGGNIGIPDDVLPLGFSINFTSNYRDLKFFLERLEQSPRLIDVSELSINRSSEEETGEEVEIDVVMQIQFYKYDSGAINI